MLNTLPLCLPVAEIGRRPKTTRKRLQQSWSIRTFLTKLAKYAEKPSKQLKKTSRTVVSKPELLARPKLVNKKNTSKKGLKKPVVAIAIESPQEEMPKEPSSEWMLASTPADSELAAQVKGVLQQKYLAIDSRATNLRLLAKQDNRTPEASNSECLNDSKS